MNPQTRIRLVWRTPIFLLIFLFFLTLFLPSRLWNILLVTFGGLVGIAYVWARLLAKGLHGSRELRFGWVAVGDRLSEQFEIHNQSGLPALWVEITDHSNVPGYQVSVVRSLGHNDVNRWRESTICLQRGHYRLGPWALNSGDPFGIFRVIIPYVEAGEIIIHPPTTGKLPLPLPAGQGSGRVRARERAWQATINAASIRDYQPSDPRSWIHWPTTARRGSLHVRQFDLDAAGPVWIVLDMDGRTQMGKGPTGTEEQAILVAAAFTAQGLADNRRVGLAAYSRNPQIILPARGTNQQWKVLRALALVTADGENDLSVVLEDLKQITKRGSAIILITPSDQISWISKILDLEQRGVECTVILQDRGSFSPVTARKSRSEGLQRSLKAQGIRCQLIRQGEISIDPSAQERRGFWEFKVTGTGKVVAVRDPFER